MYYKMDEPEHSYYFAILPDDLMKELFLYLDLPALVSYNFIYGVPDKQSYWRYRLEKLLNMSKTSYQFPIYESYLHAYLAALLKIHKSMGNILDYKKLDARDNSS